VVQRSLFMTDGLTWTRMMNERTNEPSMTKASIILHPKKLKDRVASSHGFSSQCPLLF
jgi:hypothetical protein